MAKWPGSVVVSSLVLLAVVVLAWLVPSLGVDPTEIHPDAPTALPTVFGGHAGFCLGTDDLGRDLLARLAVGAQISLMIGVATALVAVGIGTMYGILAAYSKPWVDTLMMRGVDVLYSLPGLMVVILFSVFLGRGIPSLVLAIALFSWPDTARMIRAQAMAIREELYMEAYQAIGGRPLRMLFRHLLPNLAGFVILSATMTVPRAILTESTLSFIGLGVEPPWSSWGTLASEGWQLVRVAPHMLLFPAGLILVTMVALNVLGDALRQHLEPRG
jgi:oligopeptide transport system permease protein